MQSATEKRVRPYLSVTYFGVFDRKGPANLAFRDQWCGRGDSNPHDVATASPSSWCVCQFRHFRNNKEVGVLEPAATVARELLALPQPVRRARRVH